jgi:hypothetical protein
VGSTPSIVGHGSVFRSTVSLTANVRPLTSVTVSVAIN